MGQKREKRRKYHIFSPFSTGLDSGPELEREMRETPHSRYDLRRSGGRNPSSQDLKFIYSTRATRGYQQQAILSKTSCLEKEKLEREAPPSL